MGTVADLAERDQRYRGVREAMAREGLDALIVAGTGGHFNRGHIRYFSDCHPWGGDAMILIPLSGEPTMAWVTYSGIGAPTEPWITDLRRAPFPARLIVEAMKEKNLTRGRVGIAGMARLVSVMAYEMLCSSLPDVEFVNADKLVARVRAAKSPLEIQQYRELWQLSIRAMQAFIEIVGPGVTERDAAAAAGQVFRAGGSFDDLTIITEAPYRGLPRDVPLKCDDLVALHLEICGESGHWSEIDCTCAFREPTRTELRLMESELIAYAELRRMAVPGALVSDLARKFEEVMVDQGWQLREPGWHFYFHGHGLDDIEWPWYTAMLEGNEDAILEDGMVLNYHPHRDTIPDVPWATRITDDLLITPQGGVRLSGDWDLRWRVKV